MQNLTFNLHAIITHTQNDYEILEGKRNFTPLWPILLIPFSSLQISFALLSKDYSKYIRITYCLICNPHLPKYVHRKVWTYLGSDTIAAKGIGTFSSQIVNCQTRKSLDLISMYETIQTVHTHYSYEHLFAISEGRLKIAHNHWDLWSSWYDWNYHNPI